MAANGNASISTTLMSCVCCSRTNCFHCTTRSTGSPRWMLRPQSWSRSAASAGLSVEEAADALGLSRTTAYRHWTFARAWLFSQLRGDSAAPAS